MGSPAVIVCGVLTDGRDELLAQTLASVREHLTGVDHVYVVHDGLVGRKGMAGAVQTLWDHALGFGADYLFHLEDDFTFTGPVPIDGMRAILEAEPGLAQIVLQRQSLAASEREAGGVAAHAHWVQRDGYVEQTDVFSLNPCLIPRRVLYMGWPSGPLGVGNEAGMTAKLTEAGYRFGFYGAKDSTPQVNHNGTHRSEGWAL